MNFFRSFVINVTVFLGSAIITSGQIHYIDGYIVKNNGDTLTGMIQHNQKSTPLQIVSFKRFDIANPVNYNYKKIKAYGYTNGNHFEKKLINGVVTFVECHVKGNISVYSYNRRIFIEKDSKKVTELLAGAISYYSAEGEVECSDYKELLALLTSDAENFSIPKSIKQNVKEVKELVINYNKAKSGEYIAYNPIDKKSVKDDLVTPTSDSPWSYGVQSSINLNQTGYSVFGKGYHSQVDDFQKNRDWKFGLFYQRQIITISSNLYFKGELLFSSKVKTYSIETGRENFTQIDYIDMQSSSLFLCVPLTFQYHFPLRQLSPYANLGVSANIRLYNRYNGEMEITSTLNETNSYNIITDEFEEVRDPLSVLIGLGVKKYISNNISGFFETRVEIISNTDFLRGEWDGHNFEIYRFENGRVTPQLSLSHASPVVSFIFGISFK